jgi:thiol-disulfide isomerase/thioredoxin
MAAESNKVELGSKIIDFNLLNPILNKKQSLNELKSPNGNVIIFMCNHCPYVIHILPKLVDFSKEFIAKGINFIGINSNDISSYPDDSPDKMIEYSNKYGIPFPYLFDESQEIAKKYDAACTPDIYVFNQNDALYYHGRFDAARPGLDTPVTGNELREALDYMLSGKAYDKPQYPSIGCSIKWK